MFEDMCSHNIVPQKKFKTNRVLINVSVACCPAVIASIDQQKEIPPNQAMHKFAYIFNRLPIHPFQHSCLGWVGKLFVFAFYKYEHEIWIWIWISPWMPMTMPLLIPKRETRVCFYEIDIIVYLMRGLIPGSIFFLGNKYQEQGQ